MPNRTEPGEGLDQRNDCRSTRGAGLRGSKGIIARLTGKNNMCRRRGERGIQARTPKANRLWSHQKTLKSREPSDSGSEGKSLAAAAPTGLHACQGSPWITFSGRAGSEPERESERWSRGIA